MDERLRATAIERLLPALVHRLNNAVAIFQGAFELGESASERDRENARKELDVLSHSLARLSSVARTPSVRPQVLALDPIAETCALLLRPLAQTLHVDFAIRARTGLSARVDGRLESSCFVAAFELILAAAAREREPRLVCLTIAARAGSARIALGSLGQVGLPRAAEGFEALARELGFGYRQRATRQATVLSARLPLLGERRAPVERPRASRPRVLLIQDDGQDRELAALVLREQGCEVREESGVPSTGQFELVLLDERVLVRNPGAAQELARVAYGRLECIRPPLRPSQLLELL